MATHQTTAAELTALLAVVACPEDHQPLTIAPTALVARLNALVADRALRDLSGNLIDTPMDAALVRADGQRLYMVQEGLAVLLLEQGVALDEQDRALLSP